jgi:predicted MFS family arabinose efflux permease
VATIGEGWCFFANGVSYVAVIIGLLAMRVARREIATHEESPLANIVEGFRWVASNRAVHSLLLLLAVVSLAGMPYTVLMPIFADRILHGGAKALGVLMGAAGIGALCGALILASRTQLKGLNRWVGLSATGFGAVLIAFGYSRSYPLSMGLLMLVGFFVMIENGSSNTLIQSMVPDHLRGRVMSVYSMMFMGMAPIGSLIAGALADRVGAPLTVAAGGALCVVCATVFLSFLPHIRVDARRLIVAQQMAAGDPPQEATGGGVVVEQVDR